MDKTWDDREPSQVPKIIKMIPKMNPKIILMVLGFIKMFAKNFSKGLSPATSGVKLTQYFLKNIIPTVRHGGSMNSALY